MGLDTTHGAWHGAYSAFNRWRKEIAHIAGFPPLELMEGYYSSDSYTNPFCLLEYAYPKGDELPMAAIRDLKKYLPIKWDNFEKDPLTNLLYHSDCDGHLTYGQCGKIAKRLRNLLPLMSGDLGGHIGDFKEKTLTFIEGCELAHSKKESLIFR